MADSREKDTLLEGCRVLDLTNERGLLCGKILGDFGADVIKIEPPGGDPARNIGPFYHDIIHPEKSLFWYAFNTSKRSITLNIETADGWDIFKRLVKTADFVIESFDPSYMDSLGLGYAVLEQMNPRIIMTSITPFGQEGPHAQFKGSDMIPWAMGGFMYLCADREPGSPYRVNPPQSYRQASLHAAMASMIAHYYREATGEGQHLDVSMQQATIGFLSNAVEVWDLYRMNIRGAGPGAMIARPTPPGSLKVRYHWPCKDGYVNFYAVVGGIVSLSISSKAMVEIADREGMAGPLKDYDWASFDLTKISQEEYNRIEDVFLNFFRTKTKQELYSEAIKKGIVCCPLNTSEDIVKSPQLEARGYFIKIDHPELGDTITYPGAPVKLSDSPWLVKRRPPLIGEHNEEIYVKELGFSKEELIILKGAKVI